MVPTITRCGCACHPDAVWPCVACEVSPLHTGPAVPPQARDPRVVRHAELVRRRREALRSEVLAVRAARRAAG